MTDLLVRGLDPSLIERLKAKAKQNGRSLQQEAKEILERAAPMTAAERVAAAEYLQNLGSAAISDFDVHEAIRFGRDDEIDIDHPVNIRRSASS